MAEFCSARSNIISPLQWTSLSPPFTTRKELESNQAAYCKLIIETSAKFPTKADFDMGYEYFRKGDKGNVVMGRVELMNGFGVMIPHKYNCEFEGLTLINAEAVPG